jgi:hypothetical protein
METKQRPSLRLDAKTFEKLRRTAFKKRMSMAAVIRELVSAV